MRGRKDQGGKTLFVLGICLKFLLKETCKKAEAAAAARLDVRTWMTWCRDHAHGGESGFKKASFFRLSRFFFVHDDPQSFPLFPFNIFNLKF
jgi:hypothetical protein